MFECLQECLVVYILPLVFVPKHHPHVVDDTLHAQLHQDSLSIVVINGVAGEASIHVIGGDIAIQEIGPHLPLKYLCSLALHCHILPRHCKDNTLYTHASNTNIKANHMGDGSDSKDSS